MSAGVSSALPCPELRVRGTASQDRHACKHEPESSHVRASGEIAASPLKRPRRLHPELADRRRWYTHSEVPARAARSRASRRRNLRTVDEDDHVHDSRRDRLTLSGNGWNALGVAGGPTGAAHARILGKRASRSRLDAGSASLRLRPAAAARSSHTTGAGATPLGQPGDEIRADVLTALLGKRSWPSPGDGRGKQRMSTMSDSAGVDGSTPEAIVSSARGQRART